MVIQSTWIITLTTEELRLVMKALGGRLSEDEVPLAKELGDNLTRHRGNVIKSSLKTANDLLTAIS
jgi:hypothetical protein